MDLSEIDDTKLVEKITDFHHSIDKIENMLEEILNDEVYDDLSVKEKVDYDMFVAYTMNTLFWSYLKTKGVNPLKNYVKDELARIRQYMLKAKQAHERYTIRPRLDKEAAGRFVKHNITKGQKRKRSFDD